MVSVIDRLWLTEQNQSARQTCFLNLHLETCQGLYQKTIQECPRPSNAKHAQVPHCAQLHISVSHCAEWALKSLNTGRAISLTPAQIASLFVFRVYTNKSVEMTHRCQNRAQEWPQRRATRHCPILLHLVHFSLSINKCFHFCCMFFFFFLTHMNQGLWRATKLRRSL